MKKLLVPFIVLSLLSFTGCSKKTTEPTPPPTPAPRLIVDTVSVAPNMDSVDTPVWSLVDSALVEIGGEPATYGFDPSLGKIDVTLKAIRNNDTLYIYAKWKDANADLWGNYIQHTANYGTWVQNTSEGEDKFFVFFDTGNNGSEKANCASMCHATEMKASAGGHVDIWNWKSTTTAPAKLCEDQWMRGDSGMVLDAIYPNFYAYKSNWRADYGGLNWEEPLMMHKSDTAFHSPFLFKEDAVVYKLQVGWKTLAIVPGYYIDSTIYDSPDRSASSRWDILSASRFDSLSTPHTWTVVFARALNTGRLDDDARFDNVDSVQVTIAAADGQVPYQLPDLIYEWQHSGSKPFYIILKP